ncbi:MAG TPA: hypothetical protein VI382_06185, partial [Candidatus Manganitrophaceae bacterium]|nr:hypothetical protein [Candidatus Manganitrophaceae bacterium]
MRSPNRILWTALLFFAISAHAALFSCASAETKKERHYKKGLEYAAREKYPEAVVEFKNVI